MSAIHPSILWAVLCTYLAEVSAFLFFCVYLIPLLYYAPPFSLSVAAGLLLNAIVFVVYQRIQPYLLVESLPLLSRALRAKPDWYECYRKKDSLLLVYFCMPRQYQQQATGTEPMAWQGFLKFARLYFHVLKISRKLDVEVYPDIAYISPTEPHVDPATRDWTLSLMSQVVSGNANGQGFSRVATCALVMSKPTTFDSLMKAQDGTTFRLVFGEDQYALVEWTAEGLRVLEQEQQPAHALRPWQQQTIALTGKVLCTVLREFEAGMQDIEGAPLESVETTKSGKDEQHYHHDKPAPVVELITAGH